MSLVAIWLAAAALAPTSQNFDAIANARSFLEAFSTSPAGARKLATDDALIVVGDIGGPFAEFVKAAPGDFTAKLRSCRAGELSLKPVDPSVSLDEMFGTGRDRHRKNGKIFVVEGQYICPGANRSSANSKVTVVLEDDRVAMLALWGRN